ncbi:hypothetical protein RhiJN_06015 [Ceratobasidium sp. AG-Ba]|nr:hypothetical protein RhiJN_06015 [Ceratobasidium sp. AG-Ba]
MAPGLQLSSPNSSEERIESRAVIERRPLGHSELSYFLPSRADGVNDMYLHLGFRAPPSVVSPDRLAAVWAIQRARHPLLAARIVSESVEDVRFEYARAASATDAINDAQHQMDVRTSTKDDLLDSYLNGPRLLSSDRTSYLIIAHDPASPDEHHFFLCAMHCIGDGMALHTCANEMLSFLGGKTDLEATLTETLGKNIQVPRSMEGSLPKFEGRWKESAAQIDEELLAKKQIGGQAFARVKNPIRKTVVPTVSFDEARTKKILSKCKTNGVSVSNAIFALCNIAWARMVQKKEGGAELPSLFYTALNTRPWQDGLSKEESFFRLCIGYFNVWVIFITSLQSQFEPFRSRILPTFIPSTPAEVARTFWYRARQVKIQSTKAVKSPFILGRTHRTAAKRSQQSVVWAKIDDQAAIENEKAKQQPTGLPTPAPTPKTEIPALPLSASEPPKPKPAPSTALMGLSLLGNLDGMYKHAAYGEIKLHTLTTGSRQRAGAMLLFGYTFVGKLWLCFGYDQCGFPTGLVEGFWAELLAGVDEFLAA